MYSTLKRILVGRRLATREEGHQRLRKLVALPVFSSDAISSTAYATEEILHVLVPLAAMAALAHLVPLSLVVAGLLTVVAASYRQTIHAYPNGGGAYVVSRENLGEYPSLVAGASLLVDYVLTVAVSVSAGVAAITSAVEPLRDHRVVLGVVFVALLALANLRGLKESGRVFAVPTYGYIFVLGALVGWGLLRSFTGSLDPLPVDHESLADFVEPGAALGGVGVLALMRAFSSGAVALTGIEAISNGVPAFRPPESRHAAATLTWMAVILGGFFVGISVLAQRLRPTLSEEETVLSILGDAVFGSGVLYGALQVFTAGILVLAANTAFADFPRLASIVARDGYLPRQLANRGDRLVFSNGVMTLAGAAIGLLVIFDGVTTALIPLYAVGVFTSFTLSQTGMVRHHLAERAAGWRRGVAINGVGGVATFVVLGVVLVSKFTIGAWVPAAVIPLMVLGFRAVRRHYDGVAAQLAVRPGRSRPRPDRHVVVVPVGALNEGVLRAFDYARSIDADRVVAVSMAVDDEQVERLRTEWRAHRLPMVLKVIDAPYRDLTEALLGYLDELDETDGHPFVTVVIPEFVLPHIWEGVLHNQSALVLKTRLLRRPDTVVASVPYQLR